MSVCRVMCDVIVILNLVGYTYTHIHTVNRVSVASLPWWQECAVNVCFCEILDMYWWTGQWAQISWPVSCIPGSHLICHTSALHDHVLTLTEEDNKPTVRNRRETTVNRGGTNQRVPSLKTQTTGMLTLTGPPRQPQGQRPLQSESPDICYLNLLELL